MNKVVRILGLCALVALAFGSCKKNETVIFKAATVELKSDSKTHIFNLDGYKLWWDRYDEIMVFKNGNLSELPRVFVTDTTKPIDSIASFHVYDADGDFMSELDVANSYTAYYPSVTFTTDEVKIPIHALQHRAAGGLNFYNNTYPMFGKNDDHALFGFDSDAGLLALRFVRASTLGSEDHVYIDSVTITAYNNTTDFLAGELVYDRGDGSYKRFDGTAFSVCAVSQNDVEVNDDGIYWVFVLPKGALKDGFSMKAYWNGTEMVSNTGTNVGGVNQIIAEKYRLMPDLPVSLPTPPTPPTPEP